MDALQFSSNVDLLDEEDEDDDEDEDDKDEDDNDEDEDDDLFLLDGHNLYTRGWWRRLCHRQIPSHSPQINIIVRGMLVMLMRVVMVMMMFRVVVMIRVMVMIVTVIRVVCLYFHLHIMSC